MTQKIVTLIPTSSRVTLLMRTLRSINECIFPDNYEGVHVIENGPKSEIEKTITAHSWKMNVMYHHIHERNKSKALNTVLHKLENQLIYFIDDDMRLNRQTILSMYNAAASLGRNAYFGGPLLVDYEGLPPPEWLKQYLPNSAKGLQLDIQRVEECKPGLFFGANWAAYAEDLKRVGGFNESMGPTQIAIGEDSMAQENLYKIGLRPYYVPDAIVWHFVPQSNCSQAFALKRRFKTGVYWTIKSNETTCSITKRLLKAFFIMVVNFIRMIYYLFMDDIRGIREVRFKLARQFGALFGIVFLIKNNISRCLKALFATMLYNDTE